MINEVNEAQNASINQTEYMKLFMQELTYQDPLKPVDNREFMAQMAQFSALQAAQTGNEYLLSLASTTNGNQALMMLGKYVKFEGSEGSGEVIQIKFPPNSAPKLVIDMKNGNNEHKLLREITEVNGH